MKKSSRISGFTLIEVLVSVMLSGLILTAAYSAFQGIMKSEVRLGGVMDIQRNLFYLNEKLATLIHNGGTLDYEEYFNRRLLGYDQSFASGTKIYTFSTPSNYGNGSTTTKPKILLCGKDASIDTDACLGTDAVYAAPLTRSTVNPFSITNTPRTLSGQQAYNQYRELAFNYGDSIAVPTKLPSIFPPVGTSNAGIEGIPELYLIKKLSDGSYERIYFRHIFIQDPNSDPTTAPCDPSISIKNCLGKIQMTKLKSCDNFASNGTTPGSDGKIDMWVPSENFTLSGNSINCSTVTDFSKALDDLTWVDLSMPDMNITKALFLPLPDKIPNLMAGTGEIARSPIVQVHIEVRLSESLIRRGLLSEELNTPRVLITTFDLSDN